MAGPPQGSVPWWEDSHPGLKDGRGSVWTSWTLWYLLQIVTAVGGGHALRGRASSKLPAPVYSPCHGLAQRKERRYILCVMRDLYVSGTRLFLFSCSMVRTLFLWQKKGDEERSTSSLISLLSTQCLNFGRIFLGPTQQPLQGGQKHVL